MRCFIWRLICASFPTLESRPDRAIARRWHGPIESHPLTEFSELGLAEPILRAVIGEGYTNPTPIQAQVIPAVLEGNDVLGIAQTGTGKTAAFVLPALHMLATTRAKALPRQGQVLILAPTRELAGQIAEAVKTYGKLLRPSIALIVGGVKYGPQIKAMLRGADIVVATPGRLIDHLEGGAFQLGGTKMIILDEADQMLDLGFLPSIRRIMQALPPERQTVLLSATMAKQIRLLAKDFMKTPKEIAVAVAARPVDSIDQKVLLVEAGEKRNKLVELLSGETVTRSIVFTRTKRGADKVNAHLQASGFSTAAIHGDKTQGQRDKALAAFREDKIKILVATDIAARGIDVDGISHVINYELPNVPEAYVHRIGRTARAGATGSAITLCENAERGLLRDIERLIGRSLLEGEDALLPPPSRNKGRPGGGRPGGNRNFRGPRQGGGQGQRSAARA